MEGLNIPSIIATNGAGIVLLSTILINSRKKFRYNLLDDKIFGIMIIIDLIQCFIEPASFIIIGKIFTGSRVLSLLLNSMLFINNVFFSFLWMIYSDFKLFSDVGRIRKIYRFVAIPAVITIVGALVNLFVPLYFRITPDGIYERSNLFAVPTIVAYFYMGYGAVLIYKYRNKVGKNLFMPAVIFMIPVILGTVLQFIFYGQSLLCLSIAISLNSLHINVQNEVSSTDALSGLFTRQYMNQYLSSALRGLDSKHRVAGIMLDIDKFKVINDSFGHLVGDEAIVNAGKILRASVSSGGIASRFAGDEFVIIMKITSEKEIDEAVGRIKNNTSSFNMTANKPYTLDFSIGYTIYGESGDDIDAFFARMDNKMYTDKRRKYSHDNQSAPEPGTN